MKNIIIPTVLEEDTINAVRTAIAPKRNNACGIVLLLLKDIPDDFSATSTLKSLSYTWTAAQEDVLNTCRRIVSDNCNVKLEIHHQFEITKPLLRNLMDYFDGELVILTPSFKNSKTKVNCRLVKLLLSSKYTLLHLNSVEVQSMTSALYIEPKTTSFSVQELQQLISNKFCFRIISRTKLSDELTLQDANPIIAEAIVSKQIDMLIETRTQQQSKVKEAATLQHMTFSVPVLSIYEEDLLN